MPTSKRREELKADDGGEHQELARIYVRRGLDPSLAKLVVEQLMARDALSAHARDELGISETVTAAPLQAALASACRAQVGLRSRPTFRRQYRLLPFSRAGRR